MTKATSYHYHAFGLTFQSALEIPEFIGHQSSTPVDVTITIGAIDPLCFLGMSRHDFWKATPAYFVMEVPALARFHVTEGKRITVEPAKTANFDSIRLFLLGTCLGVLFHQRGLLPIHGSAIAGPRGAVIFSGQIGAGKSSLAAAFFQQGYNLLADDIALLTIVPGEKILVVPSFPQIKLSENTAKLLGISTCGLGRVEPESSKFKLPIHQQFHTRTEPLVQIFFIKPVLDHTCQFESLIGITKFSLLAQNIYRQNLIPELGKCQKHFQQLNHICKEVVIYSVNRPTSGMAPDALAKALIPYFTD